MRSGKIECLFFRVCGTGSTSLIRRAVAGVVLSSVLGDGFLELKVP